MPTVEISNNRIKEIIKLHQKKYREETGLFIVEGLKSIQELIEAKIEIIDIFAVKEFKLNFKYSIIKENIMKKLATTSSPCEILAVAKQKPANNEIKKAKKVILVNSISDPGNLGTIIRSAAAFGVEAIILFGDCVDLYSPKVIRSTAGNFFKVPIINISEINEIKELFPNHKLVATALSKENNISIKECANYDKYIIMFGSEAKGLNQDLIKIADKNIKLEMTNNVESLNLSVSASIVLYELFTK